MWVGSGISSYVILIATAWYMKTRVGEPNLAYHYQEPKAHLQTRTKSTSANKNMNTVNNISKYIREGASRRSPETRRYSSNGRRYSSRFSGPGRRDLVDERRKLLALVPDLQPDKPPWFLGGSNPSPQAVQPSKRATLKNVGAPMH